MSVYKKISREEAVKLSILKELELHTSKDRKEDHENHPNANDYVECINISDFGVLVQSMQNEKLIRGAVIPNLNLKSVVFWDDAAITKKGKQYIIEHSAIMKGYRGLKEVQSWIDTVTGIIGVIKP